MNNETKWRKNRARFHPDRELFFCVQCLCLMPHEMFPINRANRFGKVTLNKACTDCRESGLTDHTRRLLRQDSHRRYYLSRKSPPPLDTAPQQE
jgi:hypothetical protein